MFEDGYFFNLSNFDDDFEQASMIDGVVGSIPNLKFEALAAASLNNAETSNPINRRWIMEMQIISFKTHCC